MKKYMMIVFLVIGLAVFMSTLGQAAAVIGEEAPDFSVSDTNGAEQSLSAYGGKFVVLEWFNPDCPFVKKHYGSGNMQKLQKEYIEKGVVWLSLDSSAPGNQGYYSSEDMNGLMEEAGAAATAILIDDDGVVGRMYGAATTPHIFIIDPKGKLIYQGAIDNIPGTDQAEIAQADNYVKAVLDAALKGDPVEVPPTKPYGCSVKY